MTLFFLLRGYKSLKTELKVILITLLILILLPILTVLAITNAGVQAVSDVLAAVNAVTHKVEIRNPDGDIILTLGATTTWPVCGYISHPFGVPHAPYQKYHTGIDIANPQRRVGYPVTPFMEGTVTKTDDSERTGYGKYVVVDHGNGITSLYAHLHRIDSAEGQKVKHGDVIGLLGNTGVSTGPHLHFEVRVFGVLVDPGVFMVGEPLGC